MADDRIRIIVDPDTSGFQQELNRELSRVTTDFELPVDIDTTAAKVTIQKFKSGVASDPVDVNVDVDTKRARQAVENFTNKAEATPIHKRVDLDTKRASASLNALGKSAGATFKAIGRSALSAAGIIVAALAVTASLGKDELLEADKVSARTEGTLKSLGKQATVTTKEVEDLSQKLLEKKHVDDQLIQSASNVFLANRNLSKSFHDNKNFLEQVTTAAVDAAAVMGKGVPAATKALNKALNDPIKGIKLLEKQNITLTAAQKKQITSLAEQGKKAQAQQALVAAVEKNTKSIGDRVAQDNEHRIAFLQEKFSGFAAGLLEKLLPAFEAIGNALSKALDKAGPLFNKLGAALSPLIPAAKLLKKIFFDEFIRSGPKASGIFEKINKGAKALAKAIKDNEEPIRNFVHQAGDLARGTGKALVATLKALWAIIKPQIPTIKEFAMELGEFVGHVINGVKWLAQFISKHEGLAKVIGGALMGPLRQMISALKMVNTIITEAPHLLDDFKVGLSVMSTSIKNFFTSIGKSITGGWAKFKKTWLSGVNIIVNYTKALPGRIMGALRRMNAQITTFWRQVWESARKAVVERVTAIVAFVKAIPGRIVSAIRSLLVSVMNIGKAAFENMRRAIVERARAIVAYVRTLPGRILDVIGNLGDRLYKKGRAVLNGFWNGLKSVWKDIKEWFKDITKQIVDLKGPPELDSQLLVDNGERIMTGFKDGLENKWEDVKGFLGGATGMIKGLLTGEGVGELKHLLGQLFSGKISLDDVQGKVDEITTSGLHPSSGLEDTTKMAYKIAKMFGLITGYPGSIYRSYDTVAGPGVSQHTQGMAADFDGAASALTHAATEMSKLVGRVFKQVIWLNSLWKGGKSGFGYVGGHMDHMHLGWIPRRMGGRVRAGQTYWTGENGPEPLIPDSSGFVLSNAKLGRLLSMGDRVGAMESMFMRGGNGSMSAGGGTSPVTQTNNFDVKVVHAVPDVSSLMAVLATRLESFARSALPSMAGGVA